MSKKLNFETKEKMVQLAGACFWFWNSFHSFLDSCGVTHTIKHRYPRDSFNKYEVMRNVLNDLEQAGKVEVIGTIISNFYKMRGPVDRDNLDIKRAKELLGEFRELVGNDPIEEEIQRQAQDKARDAHERAIVEHKSRAERLNDLNRRFIELHTSTSVTAQQRGFDLETLFFDLLAYSEFECRKPYRNPSGEQIDGHFKYEKFDYLVEVKWIEGPTKQADLSIFDGKIRGKAQSTRGLFLSANNFDQNAIAKFSGDSPRIVLMSGEDLALILNDQIPFDDAMRAKIDAIVRRGEIMYPLRSIKV